ncbi:gliding motility lipoprotein GldD [Myroides guanonis]|uniref:Protein involved in gliding motility GldD n=1 Tax=Myroides guanonis TaxID=1150112 RepID=A0A1I3Q8G2_9FLAO|nr:gliding motility lipoprotein GldD [Myroides guanonis]SFJ29980.1 protein involved in gliding motility GldD [Myroides guanonis]
MTKRILTYSTLVGTLLFTIACKDISQPKPDAFLALNYPSPKYDLVETSCTYSFEANDWSSIKEQKDCGFEVHYPEMKATIYINYKPVKNNIDVLLSDAQKLTYEHFIKADGISEQPYINKEKGVYGMFYEVEGNAATNAQFYATDSLNNFIVASLYFYAKPNYDSILPATDYVKNDMRKIMESLEWKKN